LLLQHIQQQLITFETSNFSHTVVNGTHSGENHTISPTYQVRIVGNQHLIGAYVLERTRHRVQIAHAVIDYRDYSTHIFPPAPEVCLQHTFG
jgi:hypothetical protein